jgi:hypothetical protein
MGVLLLGLAAAAPAEATSTSPAPPAKQPAAPVRGPFISVVDVQITGPFPLDESFIRRSLLQNHGRVRLCYKDGLAKNPRLFGHVKTRLTLETSGKVSKAEDAGSSILDAAVIDCIVKAAPTFFPKVADIVTITYTYSLRPE